MLPEPHRLHHHSDFSRTVRRGHRIGRRDVVVHALFLNAVFPPPDDVRLARVDGPRVGLIVNKAVGSAVVRHQVSRRLRHVCAQLFVDMFSATSIADPDVVALRAADLVIRALPGAASACSAELTTQLRSGFAAALSRGPDR